MTGRLYGVGLGPGDPELVTIKAVRLIGAADVIAFHSARHGRSIARSVAEPYLRGDQLEEALVYPVTTETPDQGGEYRAAMEEFYADCASRLAVHLDAGRLVVVLCEGDPFFYGSYMHLHKRLCAKYQAEAVPGVTSVSAAAAVLGRPLVERDEILTVLPGTLPAGVLAARLADTDAAAVMKLGRTFTKVRDAVEAAGRLDDAWYVERATTSQQRIEPLSEVDPSTAPYFSVAILPGPLNSPASPVQSASPASPVQSASPALPEQPTDGGPAGRSANGESASLARSSTASAPGEVVVVGLGPAGQEWLTPEADAALARAEVLIGYGPYLDRVPANPHQQRYPSDNLVEAERAAHALELARQGAAVAVISSGDPGVFAMAAAVLEVAADSPVFTEVPVRVLPGLTAAQAVASRVGAPLGHDYCVLSLSDRLKPWEIITARLEAAARADLVLALYNPASKTRTWQLAAARELLLRYRDGETPVVIGRDVGGPAESVRVVTLATLDPAEVDMRCLLLIGSSTTRVVETEGPIPRVFTPRHYKVQ